MKQLALALLAFALAAAAPAAAADIFYVTPPSVHLHPHQQTTVELTPPKQYSPQWNYEKGTCYQRQIAAATVHGWRQVAPNWYPFPATISANNRGSCELWFKAGPTEVKVDVYVS